MKVDDMADELKFCEDLRWIAETIKGLLRQEVVGETQQFVFVEVASLLKHNEYKSVQRSTFSLIVTK
jgi:hypothetical protein